MPQFLKLSFLFIFCQLSLFAQQNSTLFLMPNTPQANFVNPAIANKCRLIIGLPVLSSVHFNAGNSGFSFNQVLKKQGDNTYLFDGNSVMQNLGNVNYFDTELHTNLIFIGYWLKDNYLTFSINEKADLLFTYPGDLYALAWKGNNQFEGKTAKLGRTAAFFNYRREFAIGLARKTPSDVWWGVRAKLLFGKVNTTFTKSKIDLFTDQVTSDLNFDSDWQMNLSGPFNVYRNSDNSLNHMEYIGASPASILLNRKNMGFSTDLGFVAPLNDVVTLSGSILDLGFIYWRDNAYSLKEVGQYSYKGPLTGNVSYDSYINDLARVVQDEFEITTTPKAYRQILTPRVYLGATYDLGNNLTAGLLGTSKVNRFKQTGGLTLSLNKQFSESFTGSLSYSYLYRGLKNVGFGLKAGRQPLQFYLVTDNVIGFISPLSARNINMRFGLQLNFGCGGDSDNVGGKGSKGGKGGCAWLRQSISHNKRLNELVKKKK